MQVILKNKEMYNAEGEYIDSKHFVVKKGSQIKLRASGKLIAKIAQIYRCNKSYVDDNGYLLQDCFFSSPSTAAQFVKGVSTNGYISWKVGHETLRSYLDREQNKLENFDV